MTWLKRRGGPSGPLWWSYLGTCGPSSDWEVRPSRQKGSTSVASHRNQMLKMENEKMNMLKMTFLVVFSTFGLTSDTICQKSGTHYKTLKNLKNCIWGGRRFDECDNFIPNSHYGKLCIISTKGGWLHCVVFWLHL